MSIHLPDYSLPPPELLSRTYRVRAIFLAEIRARSGVLNIVVLSLIFAIVLLSVVVQFYFVALTGSVLSAPAPITLFFSPGVFTAYSVFLVLLSTSVGAGIIAGDVATRSITMYLSRPITHLDYLAAKIGAVGTWIALGAVAPGLVATIIVLALGYVSLLVALQAAAGFLVVGLLTVGALTGLAILLSALSSKSTFAGAGIFGTLIGAEAIATVLSAIGHRSSFLYASPLEDTAGVARSVFGITGNPLDPWTAAGILAGFAAVTMILAYLRLQRAEVVSE